MKLSAILFAFLLDSPKTPPCSLQENAALGVPICEGATTPYLKQGVGRTPIHEISDDIASLPLIPAIVGYPLGTHIKGTVVMMDANRQELIRLSIDFVANPVKQAEGKVSTPAVGPYQFTLSPPHPPEFEVSRKRRFPRRNQAARIRLLDGVAEAAMDAENLRLLVNHVRCDRNGCVIQGSGARNMEFEATEGELARFLPVLQSVPHRGGTTSCRWTISLQQPAAE